MISSSSPPYSRRDIPRYKTNSVFEARIIAPWSAVSERRRQEIMASSWKCGDAWKRCLLLFYGGGIAAGEGEEEEGCGGGGDLSLNRFAHRMHSRFLEQRTISQGSIYAGCRLVETGGVALPTPTRLRIFPFPRKYISRFISFHPLPSFPTASFPGFSIFSPFLLFTRFFSLENSSFPRDFSRRAEKTTILCFGMLLITWSYAFFFFHSYLDLRRLPINSEFLFIFDRNENVFLGI